MKKSIVAKIAVLLVVSTMTLGSSLTAFADVAYTTSQNVTVEKLQGTEVEGKVALKGYTSNDKIKIMVTNETTQKWYDVELEDGKFDEEIWLTEGMGDYTVSVLVNVVDDQYAYGPKFIVENTVEVNKFLSPGKHIESNDEAIVKLALDLTDGKETDVEKVEAIYDWVVANVSYDYDKYKAHQNKNFNNVYGALATLESGNGVCYDYSTLVAALGRASGIETKVIKGEGITRSFKGYHAWNEFYSTEEERWVKLDATFASTSGNDFFDSTGFDATHIKTEEI